MQCVDLAWILNQKKDISGITGEMGIKVCGLEKSIVSMLISWF